MSPLVVAEGVLWLPYFLLRNCVLRVLRVVLLIFCFTALPLLCLTLYPEFLGKLLTWILTEKVVFHPLKFRAIHLGVTYSFQTGRLRLAATVFDFGMANPPGFPHEDFLQVKQADVVLSVAFWEFLRNHWRKFVLRLPLGPPPPSAAKLTNRSKKTSKSSDPPSPSKDYPAPGCDNTDDVEQFLRCESLPPREGQDPAEVQCLGVIRIERLECNGIDLNFELHRGEFNINGFTRILAEGELRRRGVAAAAEAPRNCVRIHAVRARRLRAMDYNGKSDPQLVASIRTFNDKTSTQYRTLKPLWDSTLELPCDDPSAVLHVVVYDRDFASSDVIGQWRISLKQLAIKHGAVIPKQWIPLKDDKWRRASKGECGEVEMSVEWVHVAGFMEGFEKPSLTALQQLQMNSAETQLRIADLANAQHYLSNFPRRHCGATYLFDVQLVVFRDIAFQLKDLFAGLDLEREAEGPIDREQQVRLDTIELTQSAWLPPRGQDHDYLNLYSMTRSLAIRVIARAIKGKVVRSALSSIFGGLGHNVSEQLRDIINGRWSNLYLVRTVKQAATKAGEGATKVGGMMAHGYKLAMATRTRARTVEGDDPDYFKEVETSVVCEMRKLKGLRRWKPGYQCSVRGAGLFYKEREDHRHHKIDLRSVAGCMLHDDQTLQVMLKPKQKRSRAFWKRPGGSVFFRAQPLEGATSEEKLAAQTEFQYFSSTIMNSIQEFKCESNPPGAEGMSNRSDRSDQAILPDEQADSDEDESDSEDDEDWKHRTASDRHDAASFKRLDALNLDDVDCALGLVAGTDSLGERRSSLIMSAPVRARKLSAAGILDNTTDLDGKRQQLMNHTLGRSGSVSLRSETEPSEGNTSRGNIIMAKNAKPARPLGGMEHAGSPKSILKRGTSTSNSATPYTRESPARSDEVNGGESGTVADSSVTRDHGQHLQGGNDRRRDSVADVDWDEF